MPFNTNNTVHPFLYNKYIYIVNFLLTSNPKQLISFSFSTKELTLFTFWATVCKTVRPMLSDRCLSVLFILSVTFMHCGQMVGWIKMKLGMQVGLDPGHIVLDRDPAPLPQRGTTPSFRPISVAAKWLHGSRCHLVWS